MWRRAVCTFVDRQRKNGRLPHDSKAVFEEVRERLKHAIKETKFAKECRVEKEFDALHLYSDQRDYALVAV